MKTLTGDLLSLALAGEFDVIVHGANCQHVMGAGIAAWVRKRFPEAYEADLQTPRGDRAKLGTISVATIVRPGVRFDVVNAYTQFGFGNGLQIDYDAIRSAMLAVRNQYSGKRIGYPKIGAGLGGGDWGRISAIINEALGPENHTLVVFG